MSSDGEDLGASSVRIPKQHQQNHMSARDLARRALDMVASERRAFLDDLEEREGTTARHEVEGLLSVLEPATPNEEDEAPSEDVAERIRLNARDLARKALALPAGEREYYLVKQCRENTTLRHEVEALITVYQQVGSRPPAADLAAAAAGAARRGEGGDSSNLRGDRENRPGLIRGERVGKYRLLHQLGRGGFGVVYLAVRDDDEFKKKVAIKIIKPGMDSEDILARFRNERHILASLDHPNIAKLLDGGTTPEGRPYFVMEYIDGVPIDEYCRTHKLTLHQILELFRVVCAAVHYAHQNLIIHRDIGPRNILVTADGAPKLVDFGIAKFLNPEMAAFTVAYTAPAQRLMTARYASPEQARGGNITTASDVYSLSVLLYELLTGRPPYRTKGRNLDEAIRIITEHEAPRPSQAVLQPAEKSTKPGMEMDNRDDAEVVADSRDQDPEALRVHKLLKGDLDNILMMAMRKEPHLRYASVEHFAEDIRRHLEGEPVLARTPTFGYRAGKWARRNKAAALALLTGVLFTLLTFGILLYYNQRLSRTQEDLNIALQSAQRNLERSNQAQQRANRLRQALSEFVSSGGPEDRQDQELTMRELLLERVPPMLSDFRDQPRLQAGLSSTFGLAFHSHGMPDRAEQYLTEAITTLERLFETETDPEIRRDLEIEALDAKANYLYFLNQTQGYSAERIAELEAIHARLGELGAHETETGAKVKNNIVVEIADRDPDRAIELCSEMLKFYGKHYEADDDRTLDARHNLAFAYFHKGDYPRAEVELRNIISLRDSQHPPRPLRVSVNLQVLAATLDQQGKHAEALKVYRRAESAMRQVLGDSDYRLARVLYNQAFGLLQLHRLSEGEQQAEAAVDMFRTLPTNEQRLLPNALQRLAMLQIEQREFRRAETTLREAINLYIQRQEASGQPETSIVAATCMLGISLSAQGSDSRQTSTGLAACTELLSSGSTSSSLKSWVREQLGIEEPEPEPATEEPNLELEANLELEGSDLDAGVPEIPPD